jgi:UDP-glucose 4-epimerase
VRVVVTGGAGFIGANLCARLAALDAVAGVVALDDLSTGRTANLDGVDAELVVGSILDAELVETVVRDADAVVHLAARGSVPRSLLDPVATHEVNATGTVTVLDAVRRAGSAHVVVASSSSVYGANPTLPKREDLATLPMSPYAASKLATESYTLAYGASFGMPVLAFRFFNVFGPLQPGDHDYAAVIPRFVTAALTNQPLEVHGDGEQSRDFTYVGDVCTILVDALVRRVTAPEPVNLAFGTRTDLLHLIDLVRGLVDMPLRVEHVDPRPGDVRHSQADCTRLLELFSGITPTPLPDGLRATVEWLRRDIEGVV